MLPMAAHTGSSSCAASTFVPANTKPSVAEEDLAQKVLHTFPWRPAARLADVTAEPHPEPSATASSSSDSSDTILVDEMPDSHVEEPSHGSQGSLLSLAGLSGVDSTEDILKYLIQSPAIEPSRNGASPMLNITSPMLYGRSPGQEINGGSQVPPQSALPIGCSFDYHRRSPAAPGFTRSVSSWPVD